MEDTLDLNCDFHTTSQLLYSIVKDYYFGGDIDASENSTK